MTLDPSLFAATETVAGLLMALIVVTARLLGMMAVAPFFQRLNLTNLMSGVAAITFALPLVPTAAAELSAGGPLTLYGCVALALKETIVGAVIGFVFGVPFAAAQAAGDIIDLQRGSTAASLVDPSSGADGGVAGTLLTLAMMAMFYSAGGVGVAVGAVYDSYRLWPLDRMLPQFELSGAFVLLRLLNHVVFLGLLMAAPIVVALLITDVVLAFVSRAAPQLHIFDMSMALKNLIFALLIVIYCAFLMTYMRDGLSYGLGSGAVLEELLRHR